MSGLPFPELSLGLWQHFGHENDLESIKRIIKKAFCAGITHFDLANNYGAPPGSAEANFGRILKEEAWLERKKVLIATKAGFRMWEGPYGDGGSRKYMLASLEESLTRLNVDYVDIFYSHRYDAATPLAETMGALHDAVRQGRALYIGLSNYPKDKLAEAIRILKALGTPPLVYQGHYSLLDQGVKEDGTLALLEEEGVGFVPYAVFNHGLLTTKYLEGVPADSRAADKSHPFIGEEDVTGGLRERLRRLDVQAQERDARITHLALRHVLQTENVVTALIGIRDEAQLDDHLEGLAKEIDDIVPERLDGEG